MLRRLFLEHPSSVGESYGRHAQFAALTGLRMISGGLACVAHGLFPFLFVKTASRCIRELHASLDTRGNAPACTTDMANLDGVRASPAARLAP
ncbi:MAG: DUF6356 family protein [Rhodospirillaceae bacterium]|nr:DUF6356 family protein [Rhodospirillaceae bacterium]